MGFLDNIINAGRKAWSALKEDKQTQPASDLAGVKGMQAGAEALIDVPKDLPKETKQILSGQGAVAGDIQPIKPVSAPVTEVEPYTPPTQPNNIFTQAIDIVPRAISYIDEKIIPTVVDTVKAKIGENRIYSNIADEFIDSSTTPINPNVTPDKEVTSIFRGVKSTMGADLTKSFSEYGLNLQQLNYDTQILLDEGADPKTTAISYATKAADLNKQYFGKYSQDGNGFTDAEIAKLQGLLVEAQPKFNKLGPVTSQEDSLKQANLAQDIVAGITETTNTYIAGDIARSPIALNQLAQIADYTTQQVWKIEKSFPNLTQEQRDVYINQAKEEAIKAGTISYLTALGVSKEKREQIVGAPEDKQIDVGAKEILSYLVGGPTVATYLLGKIQPKDNINQIYKAADAQNLANYTEKMNNEGWDLTSILKVASERGGQYYDATTNPIFDSFDVLKGGQLAQQGFLDMSTKFKRDDAHTRNNVVDKTKKGTEIAANVTAMMLMGGAGGGAGIRGVMGAMQAQKYAVAAESILDLVTIQLGQTLLINSALKANYPEMEYSENDAAVDIFFGFAGAAIDGMQSMRAWNVVNNNFDRFKTYLPDAMQESFGTTFTLNQKAALVDNWNGVEAFIRTVNNSYPEQSNQLLKKALADRKMYNLFATMNTRYNQMIEEGFIIDGRQATKEEVAQSAFKKIQKQREVYVDKFAATANAVNDPTKTVDDIGMIWHGEIVNSAHTAPKLTDGVLSEPIKTSNKTDSAFIEYNLSTSPAMKQDVAINSILRFIPGTTVPKALSTIANAFKYDPKTKEVLTSIITWKDGNGENLFITPDNTLNKNIVTLFNTPGININTLKTSLATKNFITGVSNATSSSSTLVGKSSWNVVNYAKPTELELANPDIPKFKIDGNKIVPETTTDETMIEKKVTSMKGGVSVPADGVATTTIDGVTYAKSPIKAPVEIKKPAKHTGKMLAEDGQKVYLDNKAKVYDNAEHLDFIDNNDLYSKIYDNLPTTINSFKRHINTANILDQILQQRDAKDILDQLNTLKNDLFVKLTDYFSSASTVQRMDFIQNYEGEYKDIVRIMGGNATLNENINLDNFIADLLVDAGRAPNKQQAFNWIQKNKELINSSIIYGLKQNERSIVEQRLSLANSLPFPRTLRGDLTIEMAEMFKNNPQLADVWNKHRSDFNVMETSYLPSGVAGEVNYQSKEILIRAGLLNMNPSLTLAHEISHPIWFSLKDGAKDIVTRAFEGYQDDVVKYIMNKFGVDELTARSILQIDEIYVDTKHQYFIGEDFQGARNVREYFAMQGEKIITGGKIKNKEVRRLWERIWEWIKSLFKSYSDPKSSEFNPQVKEVFDNLSSYSKEIADDPRLLNPESRLKIRNDIETKRDKRKPMIVEEDVASKVNRLFDDYIQLEGELNSKVIDNVEALVEATYDIYSPAYNEAKKAVNAYALKYFNGDKRGIVDIIAEQFDNFDGFKPLTPSTIQHKLASYTNEVNDYVNNLGYYSRNYEEKVRQLMNEESKLLANKELTIKDLDNAKKNVKEKIIAYINKHTIKNWTMSMDKVNKVLDVVANNTMQADGKIYSVNFTSPEKWTDDISRFIYANAYDVANNITLPLPKDINVETIDNGALLKERDKFADDLLQLQANELVKRLGEYDGPIYIFTDNYQLKKNRTLLVREPMHNIVFIDPSINNVNIKVEGSNMIVSSYNKNTFDSMVKQINSVVGLTTEGYKVDYAKINYGSLDITNRLKGLFKQYKIPQAQVKGLLDKNLNYLVNLVNGRKSVYDGTYSYNFVNVKDIKQQIDNRGIIQLASKDQLIEAVLGNEAELSYVIDDGFIHELNGDYGFELGDDYVINQQQKDMLYDWIVRSYISNNHAESAAAKLRILDMFMKNTPENVSLWKDIRTQLNHRVMTDKVELMNPIVRNTIKSLFYEDLMSSDLPASIQSYIMTISDVGDYILDNYKMIDGQIDDLLRESLNSKGAKMFYETKLPSEFSRFLENYFELNSKELVNYYYKSIGTPVDGIIEQEDIAGFSIQNMNNLTTTQKKGTALLFLYDNMRGIVNDIERVNDNMNYDLTRNLKDGYYLTDRKIFNYLNGISQFDIDNTIVKYNFDKVFQPKQKAALLKGTETFLDTVSEFMGSFFDNIKQARENKAQSGVEKFYKKGNIDNVYGELYIGLRNYSKFLQKYFGGTSQTNTIISSIKGKIFNVSRFSRYNDTTKKIFSKALEDIKEAIDEGQKKLLEEIANTGFETSYDRLFKSGETSKLTLGADVNGNEMLILDSYTLPKFIERESDYLGYGKIPSKELTTSEAQLYLGGMYVETFQKFLDDAVTGKYTDKGLESTFNYGRRLANPFYYKGPVNISDDLPYLKDGVGEFFTTESIPTFYTYELLSDHSNSMNILKSFFKDEIENGVINILDMSVKNMVTVLTEVYVRLDKATGISLEKFNNDMRKIIEYSMYRSIDEIFEPEVANNFRINIKDTLKEYAGDMINVLGPIHTTTNVKGESMLDTIKYITDTDKQFRHLVKNFGNYIDSLSKLSRDHEVVQSLMQGKYTINLMGENVNVADLVINKDQRMAFDKKIARIQERLDEARDNLIDDFGVEADQGLREKFSFGDTEVKKQQKYTTTIEQVQEVTNKLWEYKSISDITNNMNYLLSDATYINKQNLIFKPNIYQKNYTELPDNFDRTEKYLSKKHYEPKDIDIDTTTRDKGIDEMRMQDSTMDDLLTDCL